MTKSEQQRQKKLAKKKAKERQKHTELARQKTLMASKAGLVSVASGAPKCWVAERSFRESGIGSAVIARQIPRGQFVTVVFMLDVYCLGVKDIAFRVLGAGELQEIVERLTVDQGLAPVPPGEFRALVEAAVDYAEGLGFAPYSDYRKVSGIFQDIDPLPLPDKYQFGFEGKPLYVNGPFDSPERQKFILNTLSKSLGEGNYHFTLRLPDAIGMQDAFIDDANEYGDDDEDDEDDYLDAAEYKRV